MKRIFLFLFLLVFMENKNGLMAQLQDETSPDAPNHLYSFTISIGGAYCNYEGAFFQRYWEDLMQGTVLEGKKLSFEPSGGPPFLDLLNVSPSLEWRYKFKKPNFISQWEWSTGPGFYSIEGNYSKVKNLESTNELGFDSTFGESLKIVGLSWHAGISVHTKAILRYFGFTAGACASAILARAGNENTGIGNYPLPYTLVSRYTIGLPLGIKFNASCDLNLEFTYKPMVMFSGEDVFHLPNQSGWNQFTVGLRYKFLNHPASDPGKRIDMFF